MNHQTLIESDPFKLAADALIAECGGDPRQAVIMLIGANDYLDRRVQALEGAVSTGYVRLPLLGCRER